MPSVLFLCVCRLLTSCVFGHDVDDGGNVGHVNHTVKVHVTMQTVAYREHTAADERPQAIKTLCPHAEAVLAYGQTVGGSHKAESVIQIIGYGHGRGLALAWIGVEEILYCG